MTKLKLSHMMQFSNTSLKEPSRAALVAYKESGDAPPRQAKVVMSQAGSTTPDEAIVELTAAGGKVVSWRLVRPCG